MTVSGPATRDGSETSWTPRWIGPALGRETLTIGRHEPVARHVQRSHLAYGMEVTLEEARLLLARARVEVSLERNGGFASVRSSPAARGLPGAAACLIELRGDNKQFKLFQADGRKLRPTSSCLLRRAQPHRSAPCPGRWPPWRFRHASSNQAFLSRLNDALFPEALIEACLAHQKKDQVAAAYNHARLAGPRRALMQVWADMPSPRRPHSPPGRVAVCCVRCRP